MAVNDEIWRPGYDGPPPVTGSISMPAADPVDPSSDEDHRRGGAKTAAFATAAAVMLASIVLIAAVRSEPQLGRSIEVRAVAEPELVATSAEQRLDRSPFVERQVGQPLDPLDGTGAPFAGADPRRLPSELVSKWTVELGPLVADGGDHTTTWIEAVDDRYVVVGIGDLRTLSGPGVVVVLDAATGEQLWAEEVPIRIDQVEFVAAIGDVLVLSMASEVVARDLTSGSRIWDSRLAKVGGPLEQIAHLQGTDLLARTGPEPDSTTALIHAMTGAVVGVLVGEILGTDGLGAWYVLRGDKVLEFDLSPPSLERSDGELVATLDSESVHDAVVVGDSLVTAVDGMVAVGPLTEEGERNVGPGGFTPLTVDVVGPEPGVLIRSIVAMSSRTFLTIGGGMIGGAEVVDGAVRFAWHRPGAVTTTFATERGAMLLVATDGGATQTLVDASNGATIAALTMTPGFLGALDVVGNGILTRRTSPAGPRIEALDLDGNRIWSLVGTTPVAVGDGVVVRSTPQADGSFEVAAYGDDA